ncbi:hypothetical protein QVA66_04190 [Staphylococcus chromogenes]|nr:hypothetical protein [Staphylococcus chromogenes]
MATDGKSVDAVIAADAAPSDESLAFDAADALIARVDEDGDETVLRIFVVLGWLFADYSLPTQCVAYSEYQLDLLQKLRTFTKVLMTIIDTNNVEGVVMGKKVLISLLTVALATTQSVSVAEEVSPGVAQTATTVDLTPQEQEALGQIEAELQKLDEMTPEEIERIASEGSDSQARGIPLPGPAAIIGCVLNAGWVFRDGSDSQRIYAQLAEIVIGCVGIPLGSHATVLVAKQIWKYRQKIAAALALAGISAAHLAPFVNAPEPQ